VDDKSLLVSYPTIPLISDPAEPPASSLQLLALPILLYLNWEFVASRHENPFRRIIWVTNRLPDSPEGHALYAKSYWVSDPVFSALSG